jgi:hypothetical protein
MDNGLNDEIKTEGLSEELMINMIQIDLQILMKYTQHYHLV